MQSKYRRMGGPAEAVFTFRKGMTKGRKGKLVASCSREWNSSMVTVEFWGTTGGSGESLARHLRCRLGKEEGRDGGSGEEPTTRARTRLRTLSPISGEMSLPNCCSVVRKRFSLLSWRAPQVAGSCWLASDEEEEEDGPLLYLCGGDGTAFRVGGE